MDPKHFITMTFGLFASAAVAATLNVSWQHPTQFTDNSPLTIDQIESTRIEYGDCDAAGGWGSKQGETIVAAPATSVQITTAGWGLKCVRGYTRATAAAGGQESAASGVANKNVPPPVPQPPTFITVETVAYEIRNNPAHGVMLGRAVGTVEYNTPCGDVVIVDTGRGKYYEVQPDLVTFSKAPKSAIVVARCWPV